MSKLNPLRRDFLKHVKLVANYTGHWTSLDGRPLMFATYEYFRNRHIENVTTFTPEEHSLLKQNMPLVYKQLGIRWGLSEVIERMGPEHVFDYVKVRSANQFLIDDVGKFVPNDIIKIRCIREMYDAVSENDHLLELSGSDHEFGDYPREPVPEHNGVPKSHDWWARLEDSYTVFTDFPFY